MVTQARDAPVVRAPMADLSAEIADRQRMRAGLPGWERRIDVNGVTTAVYEAGDGPPLVLLHGAIECGGAIWGPVVAPLAAQFRVVVPDVPGLGESDAMARIDRETFAEWFSGFLRGADIQRPVLVAHSVLGSMAAWYAGHHSTDLQRLIVSGAPGIGPFRMPMRLRYVATRFAIRANAANAERFERFALLDLDATRRRDPAWHDAFSAYWRSRAKAPHVKRTMRQLVGIGTQQVSNELLQRIAVPVDLLWGRGDRMVPLTLAEDAAARLGWPLHVIPHAAHVPHIEQPNDVVQTLCTILGHQPERA